MKRKMAFVLTAVLLLGLTACGAANDSNNTNNSPAQTESDQTVGSSVQDNEANSTESVDNTNTENAGTGKVLIAYFAELLKRCSRKGKRA